MWRSPLEDVFSSATIATVAVMLYTSLATLVHGKEGCPLGQVAVDLVAFNGTYNLVVMVIEPKAVVSQKGSRRECVGETFDTYYY